MDLIARPQQSNGMLVFWAIISTYSRYVNISGKIPITVYYVDLFMT